MLSFFPTPYPDEVLYSVLARYHVRSGNTSPKATIQELFNSRTVTATVDLPATLRILVQNLPLFSKHTVESLAYSHTLYPFYAAFLPDDRAARVLESMSLGQGGDIHNRTGIMASAVESPRYLRFCPICLSADEQKYGEAYWHRLHQVPGVLVCPIHAVFLLDSTVGAQGANKHEYHAASPQNCPVVMHSLATDEDTIHKLIVLAQDISWLLTNRPCTQSLELLRQKYTSLLIEKRLATPSGRVHQKELIDSFVFFYGREFLQSLDSMVNYDEPNNWLCSIGRKHRKTFHPVRHLLTIRFLGQSIENFFRLNYEHPPFGDGPWICLNAASSEHYLRPAITDLVLTYDSGTKKPVGTFSCACGFIYSRTGPDTTDDDRYRIGKIKAYGPVWEEKLRQLVQVEKLGLRMSARQLKVDPNTVKRYALLLGLETSWLRAPIINDEITQHPLQSQVNQLEETLHQHREAWQNLQNQYPQASRTALRNLAPAVYVWLYRHDREWLLTNSPVTRVLFTSVQRVNWDLRDREVLATVKKAVSHLLAAPKPIRLTISRIAKSVDLLALLEKHYCKLPNTKQYLDVVVETNEHYQIRRIQWAARTLEEQGKEVKAWEIIRTARLRPGYTQQVGTAIENEVKRSSYVLSVKEYQTDEFI